MAHKVLVVEDSDFTRLSLAQTLKAEGFDVAAAATASEAATLAQPWQPDVAVLDLHLGPGPTGIDLAKLLRRDNPRIGIVLLTSYDDPRMLNTSLPEPPAGTQYVTKRSVTEPADLVRAMANAVRSHVVKPAHSGENVLTNLTDAQHDVLRLIASGYSNQHIALTLARSVKAVESSVNRLVKTLDIPNGSDMNQRVLLARAYFAAGNTDDSLSD